MDIRTFNRYEEKYFLSDEQKNQMTKYLQKYCAFDPYCDANKSYHIYNLYYDTPDGNVIRQSVQQPKFKEKLRMRSYKLPIGPMDVVFLEIKKKVDGRINKRRIRLPYGEAVRLIEEGIQPDFEDYESRQVLSEINYFLEMNPVRPNYYISYERIALSATDGSGIRITFDGNIVERTGNLTLSEDSGTKVLREGEWLMEIKTARNYPLWLASKLSELAVYSRSFSKVGSAYKMEIRGVK